MPDLSVETHSYLSSSSSTHHEIHDMTATLCSDTFLDAPVSTCLIVIKIRHVGCSYVYKVSAV